MGAFSAGPASHQHCCTGLPGVGWGVGVLGGGIGLFHVGAASRRFVKFNDNVTQLTLWPNIYDFNAPLKHTIVN